MKEIRGKLNKDNAENKDMEMDGIEDIDQDIDEVLDIAGDIDNEEERSASVNAEDESDETPSGGEDFINDTDEEIYDSEVEDFSDDEDFADEDIDTEDIKSKFAGSRHIAGGIIALILIAAAGIYSVKAVSYKSHFFPNTFINGINASDKTVDELTEMIKAEVHGYTARITSRGNEEALIRGSDIGLDYEADESLKHIIDGQNPMSWGMYLGGKREITLDTSLKLDDASLDAELEKLPFMDKANQKEPADAYISEYVQGSGFSIIPEENGSSLKLDEAREFIKAGILEFSEEIALDSEGNSLYKEAEIKSDNAQLLDRLAQMNKYVSADINYLDRAVLDGSIISKWLITDSDGNVSVDDAKLEEYVDTLAEEFDTVNKAKDFKTSYGNTVSINGGNLGWKLNREAEAAAIRQLVYEGSKTEREPEFEKRGISLTENEYGDTYVEINLTAQHMFYYKDGQLVVESDFVSGNESRGWGTPPGVFQLSYKQRNAILKGEGYKTPVSYWMPFNRGIGLHDAYWRGNFGGGIYRTSGSHGCINLPPVVAKTIYETIPDACPIICYKLPGTESKTPTKHVNTLPVPSLPPSERETPAPAETDPAETETQAPQESQIPSGPENSGTEGGSTEPVQGPGMETHAETAPQETPVPAGPGTSGGSTNSGPEGAGNLVPINPETPAGPEA